MIPDTVLYMLLYFFFKFCPNLVIVAVRREDGARRRTIQAAELTADFL